MGLWRYCMGGVRGDKDVYHMGEDALHFVQIPPLALPGVPPLPVVERRRRSCSCVRSNANCYGSCSMVTFSGVSSPSGCRPCGCWWSCRSCAPSWFSSLAA